MSARRQKAVGVRGSWFAKVGDETLPCVHQHWIKSTRHVDPNYDEADAKWTELRDAISSRKRVILTKDIAHANEAKKSGLAFERTGYIAVYDVENVEVNDRGLSFDLVNRVCDLK